jgi:TPP-dependent pyruvate/acetoin dehydrogenase alpha subunit
LIVLRKHLADATVDAAEIKEIETKVDTLIEEAVKFAVESPEPSEAEFLNEIMAL